MNATTSMRGGHAAIPYAGSARRALATIAAACGRRERGWLLLGYAVFALLAVAMVGKLSPRMRDQGLLLILMLPTFLLWTAWFSRALLLHLEARAACIPALSREVGNGLAWMVVATVLLPGALLAMAGTAPLIAFAGLASIALAGLLFALLPRGVAALASLLPMLWQNLVPAHMLDGVSPPLAWPLAGAALALLVAWRWRVIVRSGAGMDAVSWRQPMLFAMGRRGSFWGGRDMADPQVQIALKPRWMQRLGTVDGLGPQRPVAALRAWLGAPFALLSWRQWLVQGVLLLAIGAVVWRALLHDHHGTRDAWPMAQLFGLAVGGSVLVATYAMRLQALRRQASGELAELALLPGWGGPAQARRTLLWAIAQPMGRMLALGLLLVAVLGVLAGDDVLRMALQLAMVLSLAALGGLLCLRALGAREMRPYWTWIMLLAGAPLFGFTAVALQTDSSQVLPEWMTVIWSMLGLLALALLWRAWRRFRVRPHPFLSP